MLKTLLISGSPKPDGNTVQLMRECAKVIEEQGVEAEVVSFAGMSIQSCTACGKCSETGKCDIEDGLNEIIEKLRARARLYCGRACLLRHGARRCDGGAPAHRLRFHAFQ